MIKLIIHARIVLTGNIIHVCEYIDKQSVTSMPLLDWLVDQRWLSFLTIDVCCHLMNVITSLENDAMDKTHPFSLA